MKKSLSFLLTVMLLAAAASLPFGQAAAQPANTITLLSTADARVLAVSPTTNHGSVSRLDVDDPGEQSYIRFDVGGVTGPITSAVLRLYVTNGSSNGPSIYSTSGDWTEAGITWNTAPAAAGSAIGNLGAIAAGMWVEVDLTTMITGDGSYNFVLRPDSADGASFYSREGSSPPQLVLTVSTGAEPTATHTSTSTPVTPNPGTATFTATVTNTTTSTITTVSTATATPTATILSTSTATPTRTATATNTQTATKTPTPTETGAVNSHTLAPAADARVLSTGPNTNYGTLNRLDVDSPGEQSYIRFNVSGITSSVTSAKLRLYVTNGSSNGPSIYSTSSTWAETTITWNNRPAPSGSAIANLGAISSGSWVEFDVTAAIAGDGSYDFAILPDSTDGASFYSREASASLRPQLVISFGSGPVPTPTFTPTAGPSRTPTNTPSGDSVVFVGAGDIADCSRNGDEQTALLLDNIPGTIFTIGDNAYPIGSASNYTNCYNPSWGRHKNRTRPAVGDNEYNTAGAAGYFGYFGAAAGEPGKGYYSYNLGSWHIIVLNSECSQVGGCGPGSPQGQWLAADLAANPATCTLAIFHEPYFSSNGGDTDLVAFWEPLYAAGAEIVLGGHRHNYERFLPQSPSGVAEPDRGIRQFVVGTGGSSLSSFDSGIAANSQVRNATTNGVLRLTLHPTSYDWEFIPVAGQTFRDSGSAQCITP